MFLIGYIRCNIYKRINNNLLFNENKYYRELLSEKWLDRDVEQDAIDSDAVEEKHFG